MPPQFFKRPPRLDKVDYTPRQLAIIEETIPLSEIKSTELAMIMKKAIAHEDDTVYDVAKSLYFVKQGNAVYAPEYSIEESKAILQSLTPWNIRWNDTGEI